MYARQRIAELTAFGKYIADAGACVAVFCRGNTPYRGHPLGELVGAGTISPSRIVKPYNGD
jgi:hypothetical protein